jgi:hypothetical protein
MRLSIWSNRAKSSSILDCNSARRSSACVPLFGAYRAIQQAADLFQRETQVLERQLRFRRGNWSAV